MEIASKNTKQSFAKLYKIDTPYKGIVRRVTNFGAFVELPKGGEGLLHISKLSSRRIEKVTDIVDVDDEINITIVSIDRGKMELSLNDVD